MKTMFMRVEHWTWHSEGRRRPNECWRVDRGTREVEYGRFDGDDERGPGMQLLLEDSIRRSEHRSELKACHSRLELHAGGDGSSP
jgi:hypothetical protein